MHRYPLEGSTELVGRLESLQRKLDEIEPHLTPLESHICSNPSIAELCEQLGKKQKKTFQMSKRVTHLPQTESIVSLLLVSAFSAADD